MTLALVLVIVAAFALVVILGLTVSTRLQLSPGSALARKIEPVDIEAFRNLVDPTENEYLQRRLSPAEFRKVQRERLRAAAAYIRVAGRNAAVLVAIGQAALNASDGATVDAARQLVDNALLLRRNASVALLRIYFALAWPHSALAAAPVLHGYEQLNGRAMLLGRLQNPGVPIRIAAN
ncbi:MAG TPA: hypothetical protein VNX87_08945 [Candidatus Sulfotelmatobacter sp.]|jgi:hypothetical protein|nr:hypothetical protein [Candidatus Sulfotelmatobacter sp.]